MTFCISIKTKNGIVGISDTRITSGTETTTAKKVYINQKPNHSLYIMTSGLRSVRDKALTYFREIIESEDGQWDKLYKAVNALAQQVRRVAEEDKKPLLDSGLRFNLHALVGGQFENDDEHKVYLLYPEGNWIELGEGSPYFIIGSTGYGKPILDRTLKYDSEIPYALKAAFLSFEATRISSNDVDYPIDVVIYPKNSFNIVQERYLKEELQDLSALWSQNLSNALQKLPESWMDKILMKQPNIFST